MSKYKVSFEECNREGEKAEEIVLSLFKKAGFKAWRDVGSGYKWDVLFVHNDTEFSIEVKFDKYEKKSGNIAVEVFNPRSNKPSGLSSTLSTFWVYVLSNGEVWLTLSSLFKKYVDEHAPLPSPNKCGDGNANILLYRKSELMSIFFLIDDVEALREIIIRGIKHG